MWIAAGHQRLVLGAEIGVAVYRRTERMGAVIALLEAEKLDAAGLAAQLVVLTRKPQCHLDAVGSAGGEEGAAQAVRREELAQHEAQFDHRVVAGAAERRVVGQGVSSWRAMACFTGVQE
jgi:hypothetical protein